MPGTPHQRLSAVRTMALRGSSTAKLRAERRRTTKVLGQEVLDEMANAVQAQFDREAELDKQYPDRHRRPRQASETRFAARDTQARTRG